MPAPQPQYKVFVPKDPLDRSRHLSSVGLRKMPECPDRWSESFTALYQYLVALITVSFRRDEVTEKSLITLEKISPRVYPRVKRGAGSEVVEGVEMTYRELLQLSTRDTQPLFLISNGCARFAAHLQTI
jgi:hypothetical protein